MPMRFLIRCPRSQGMRRERAEGGDKRRMSMSGGIRIRRTGAATGVRTKKTAEPAASPLSSGA